MVQVERAAVWVILKKFRMGLKGNVRTLFPPEYTHCRTQAQLLELLKAVVGWVSPGARLHVFLKHRCSEYLNDPSDSEQALRCHSHS